MLAVALVGACNDTGPISPELTAPLLLSDCFDCEVPGEEFKVTSAFVDASSPTYATVWTGATANAWFHGEVRYTRESGAGGLQWKHPWESPN